MGGNGRIQGRQPEVDNSVRLIVNPPLVLIPKCCRYIFKHNVITDTTKLVMNTAMDIPVGQQLNAPWPGKKFGLDDYKFTALLGTLHGRGIIYFLVQHPKGLPGKKIESITVFTTQETQHEYHLLFTLTGPGNERARL